MVEELSEQLRGAAASHLQRAVRAALGEPEAEIAGWQLSPLGGGISAEGSLWLLSGSALSGAVTRSWSLVLKLLAPTPGRDDPAHIAYWAREGLLYRSHLLDALPGDLGAPRCFASDEQPDGRIWLWLEHIRETVPGSWPLDRWAQAARHLGLFNGAYLAGRPLPRAPWLGGQRLRTWLEGHGHLVDRIALAPSQPVVRGWWPQPVVDRILRLWDERSTFCAALERLPQTFCHGDAIRRNLFAVTRPDGSAQTVAIDWQFAGYMAPGEEVGQTLSVAAAFYDLDPAALPTLDEALFTAYLDGLREAGWRGDAQAVRFAYCAHAALRNLFNAVGATVPDASTHPATQRRWGHSWQELAERRAAVRPFLLQRAEEARNLLDSL
jgi:hypothetical protein